MILEEVICTIQILLITKTVLEKKYASSEEIVPILTEWAHKNHFELVIRKNDKDRRVQLRTPKDSEQECSKNENARSHSLTLEEFQLLSKAKKLFVGLNIIDIRKAIDGTDGKYILIYDDIRNWKVEVESHDKSMDKIRNSAFDIIYRTESRDYSVRYQASSNDKDVKSMFFIHSSAAAGEVFGIYATYKGSNKAMPLASIQSVSHLVGNSLTTNSIAYAIVSEEST
ncbi:hypothetical protein G6F42_020024 [Rhizopus arrhizus]|nr:hypothetical protein G6F42_020024 [Rhizopus arrhizus]